MKKFLFLFILFGIGAINQNLTAQFDYFGGGGVLSTGGKYEFEDVTYINKSIGIDLRASYNYSKKLKIVPDFKFYFPQTKKYANGGDSKVTVFALNVNAHFILNAKSRDKYKMYLLAGAHVGAWQLKNDRVEVSGDPLDVNDFKFVPGANLGGGLLFDVGNRTKVFVEAKFVVSQASQLVFTPGLLYNL